MNRKEEIKKLKISLLVLATSLSLSGCKNTKYESLVKYDNEGNAIILDAESIEYHRHDRYFKVNFDDGSTILVRDENTYPYSNLEESKSSVSDNNANIYSSSYEVIGDYSASFNILLSIDNESISIVKVKNIDYTSWLDYYVLEYEDNTFELVKKDNTFMFNGELDKTIEFVKTYSPEYNIKVYEGREKIEEINPILNRNLIKNNQ